MTPPLPLEARPPVIESVGLLRRLKLAEPARLYGYSVLAAILTALALTGTITGEWSEALTGVAAAVLGIPAAVESIRPSVYSTNGMVETVRRAADRSGGSW